MNSNLSSSQFGQSSMTKMGAMPIKEEFNGPSPLPDSNVQNKLAPNANLPLPKPGFF